jgi:hypothetical protein
VPAATRSSLCIIVRCMPPLPSAIWQDGHHHHWQPVAAVAGELSEGVAARIGCATPVLPKRGRHGRERSDVR